MADLSTFQTTSFYTRLSFLDEENDDSLLEDEEELEEEEDENSEDDSIQSGPSGENYLCCIVFSSTFTVMECICFFLDVSKDKFDHYLTQLLHITTQKIHLPPIQRGQHHVFSAEHTTRDILSFMAQVQGLNVPREFLIHQIYCSLSMYLCSNFQNI